jgi:hypothetical protein
MREGERARIHVPAALGYGAAPQGSKVTCDNANRGKSPVFGKSNAI